jgi:hypothetical protein
LVRAGAETVGVAPLAVVLKNGSTRASGTARIPIPTCRVIDLTVRIAGLAKIYNSLTAARSEVPHHVWAKSKH